MKIKDIIPLYLNYLKSLGRSYYTIRKVKYGLKGFTRFMEGEDTYHIEALTREIMEEYQEELAFTITAKGALLSLRTQQDRLSCAKCFTRFLKDRDYLVSDPGEKIKLPKQPKRLPKVILNRKEVKQILNAPDTRTNQGYRNRVILEILYDTAIRRLELSNIKINDMDLNAGYIHIQGKGNKERVVPLSKPVCEMVHNYIMAVRPAFLNGDDSGYLILNRWGGKMDPNGIWAVVKRCAHLAKIKKNVSTHTFRHTCATHMLKNGAPVRHLQEMLGHESLESTQIYTRVTINDLKEIHAKYHPGETMKEPE
ncbi:MAG: tyrosine-type recombinase/integrase [Thermodesulfobacteriota bacterium]|nr:tyrosine-type recombinase/integrase [Thermodesulfobacteriota bacterium]